MTDKDKPIRSHKFIDVYIQSKDWTAVFTRKYAYELIAELHDVAEATYALGRRDEAENMKHTQEKLLDGFAHPSDCPQCKRADATHNN